MKISTYHRSFSDDIRNKRALEHPEEFLGPNWKDVLNFWLFMDTLTEEQIKLICSHNWYDTYVKTYYEVLKVSSLVTVLNVDIAWSGIPVFENFYEVEDYNTGFIAGSIYELIASHLLLEQNHPLFFVKLLLDTLKTVS